MNMKCLASWFSSGCWTSGSELGISHGNGGQCGDATRTQAGYDHHPPTVLSVMFPILGSHLCSLLPTQSLDC